MTARRADDRRRLREIENASKVKAAAAWAAIHAERAEKRARAATRWALFAVALALLHVGTVLWRVWRP